MRGWEKNHKAINYTLYKIYTITPNNCWENKLGSKPQCEPSSHCFIKSILTPKSIEFPHNKVRHDFVGLINLSRCWVKTYKRNFKPGFKFITCPHIGWGNKARSRHSGLKVWNAGCKESNNNPFPSQLFHRHPKWLQDKYTSFHNFSNNGNDNTNGLQIFKYLGIS